jgi:hypothetical protein
MKQKPSSALDKFLNKCKANYDPSHESNARESPWTSSKKQKEAAGETPLSNTQTPNRAIQKVSVELLNSVSSENRKFKRVKLDVGEDPALWRVDMDDLVANSSFGKARYFKKQFKCDFCSLFTDHPSRLCSKKTEVPIVCHICGDEGHLQSKCRNRICSKCNEVGHAPDSCSVNFKQLQCDICNTNGHEPNHCPTHWRKYHITTDQDIDDQDLPLQIRMVNKRYCSFCSLSGHFSFECRRHEFSSRTSWPTSPFLRATARMFNCVKLTGNDSAQKSSKPLLELDEQDTSSCFSSVDERQSFVATNKRKNSTEVQTNKKKAKWASKKGKEKLRASNSTICSPKKQKGPKEFVRLARASKKGKIKNGNNQASKKSPKSTPKKSKSASPKKNQAKKKANLQAQKKQSSMKSKKKERLNKITKFA